MCLLGDTLRLVGAYLVVGNALGFLPAEEPSDTCPKKVSVRGVRREAGGRRQEQAKTALTKSDEDACVEDDAVPIDVSLPFFIVEPWLLELANEAAALEATPRAKVGFCAQPGP